jgi:hypothetical protein
MVFALAIFVPCENLSFSMISYSYNAGIGMRIAIAKHVPADGKPILPFLWHGYCISKGYAFSRAARIVPN